MVCLSMHIVEDRNHQQFSQSLADKSGSINLSLGQGTEPAFRPWKIKENHIITSELASKLYDKNIWHVTKAIICQSFIHITIFVVVVLVKYHLYPNLGPNQWFQVWPPELVSIADGPYHKHGCLVHVQLFKHGSCISCYTYFIFLPTI